VSLNDSQSTGQNDRIYPRQAWAILILDAMGDARIHPEAFGEQAEANQEALRLNRSGLKVKVYPININSWGQFDSQQMWFGKD